MLAWQNYTTKSVIYRIGVLKRINGLLTDDTVVLAYSVSHEWSRQRSPQGHG